MGTCVIFPVNKIHYLSKIYQNPNEKMYLLIFIQIYIEGKITSGDRAIDSKQFE